MKSRDWRRSCWGKDLDVSFESRGMCLREECESFERAGCEIGSVVKIYMEVSVVKLEDQVINIPVMLMRIVFALRAKLLVE